MRFNESGQDRTRAHESLCKIGRREPTRIKESVCELKTHENAQGVILVHDIYTFS